MKYKFIDLFAGCGGLSEGFYMEDYHAQCHIEIDRYACETLKERMRYYEYDSDEIDKSVLCEDITNDNIINIIEKTTKGNDVDVIIGGPPCQSFSSLGRAKDPHSMKYDSRNYLFESYINILNHFKPKFFVFENVPGILSAKVDGEHIINTIFDAMSENYKICEDQSRIVLNAADYGVPQMRKRVIIIGVRNDLNIEPEEIYDSMKPTHYDPNQLSDYMNQNKNGDGKKENFKMKRYVTVADAISDLPRLMPGEGEDIITFNSDATNEYLSYVRKPDFSYLYNHVARTHNELDVKRYTEMAKNEWTLTELYEDRPDLEHPTRRLFNNSYVVQMYNSPARTIIAHLYKDGNQFIHPDFNQGRTFTVREAARVQSFPDDFRFMGSRTQQFKQVGNAVPPLFAKHIAKTLESFLDRL